MNWFCERIVASKPLEWKKKILKDYDLCEHVEKDPSLLYMTYTENDSFGIVSGYACCKACDDKWEEEKKKEIHYCHDCNEAVEAQNGIFWKRWDFSPSEGDKELFICNYCKTEPKHLERVAKDRKDFNDLYSINEYLDDIS